MTVCMRCAVLCCLQPQFNFSSASHSLLSVFRALSGTHGQAIAARSKDAVAQQVAILLPMAQAVGPVCVTTMPAEQRDKYIKQVLVVQGLVALTSAVARNVTAMLPQVGTVGLTALGHTDSSVQQGYIRSRQHSASGGWKQSGKNTPASSWGPSVLGGSLLGLRIGTVLTQNLHLCCVVQVSMGSPPLLASMGKLERMVMVQVAATDPWKQARDVAKKAAATAAAAGAAEAAAEPGSAQAAAGAEAAPAAAEAGAAAAAVAAEAGDVADADAEAEAAAGDGDGEGDGDGDEDMDAAAADG